MQLKQFKALTFDVVGTLIDYERGILDYVRKVGGDAAAALSDEQILEAYSTAHNSPGAGKWPSDLERCYHVLAERFGLPDSELIAKGLPRSIFEWPAFDDSVAALKRLRRHYTLVATTNAERWALEIMSNTLGHPFDLTVTVDDVRFEKPDPQFFAYARGLLAGTKGIRFEQILHVAQSQYHDIGVARRLGYQVCWIERRQGKPGPGGEPPTDLTVPDYHYARLESLADAVEAEYDGRR
ncbi:HAD family hydrolase [Halotalea alkalilenta]|uniref:2-haloalkanoic acid dehalogenase n=1 Tax=Halotalea alkalilenta TaxID=376489 RepID=A0A172YDM8_9GAMM|nr:HAD-IA family hydrolase [Halotalea alkalilenta]ANF57348.1 2-haloalkanoic acid dehalogenase [Halotalea alkalilenta]